jgi:hypothetical protein
VRSLYLRDAAFLDGNINAGGVQFKVRNGSPGVEMDGTRVAFPARQLLPRRVQAWNATPSRVEYLSMSKPTLGLPSIVAACVRLAVTSCHVLSHAIICCYVLTVKSSTIRAERSEMATIKARRLES